MQIALTAELYNLSILYLEPADDRSISPLHSEETRMDRMSNSQGMTPHMTRRVFGFSCGAGICALVRSLPTLRSRKSFRYSPTLFAPFVVAAERKIFEKLHPRNELRAVRRRQRRSMCCSRQPDIGATTEFGGLSRWDKGASSTSIHTLTSRQQIGAAARGEIKAAD
jgi:hypothetical protein